MKPHVESVSDTVFASMRAFIEMEREKIRRKIKIKLLAKVEKGLKEMFQQLNLYNKFL